MEVKIGVQNVGREIVLESNEDADSVAKVVEEAISNGGDLRLGGGGRIRDGEGNCCSRTNGVRPEGWTHQGSDPV